MGRRFTTNSAGSCRPWGRRDWCLFPARLPLGCWLTQAVGSQAVGSIVAEQRKVTSVDAAKVGHRCGTKSFDGGLAAIAPAVDRGQRAESERCLGSNHLDISCERLGLEDAVDSQPAADFQERVLGGEPGQGEQFRIRLEPFGNLREGMAVPADDIPHLREIIPEVIGLDMVEGGNEPGHWIADEREHESTVVKVRIGFAILCGCHMAGLVTEVGVKEGRSGAFRHVDEDHSIPTKLPRDEPSGPSGTAATKAGEESRHDDEAGGAGWLNPLPDAAVLPAAIGFRQAQGRAAMAVRAGGG